MSDRVKNFNNKYFNRNGEILEFIGVLDFQLFWLSDCSALLFVQNTFLYNLK